MTIPNAPINIPTSTKFWNFFERVIWTIIQVISAEGILSVWEAVNGEVKNRSAVLVVLTALLAALKNAITQTFINPTGATLPESLAPKPAEVVVAETKNNMVVASNASVLDNGTPVEVWKVAA